MRASIILAVVLSILVVAAVAGHRKQITLVQYASSDCSGVALDTNNQVIASPDLGGCVRGSASLTNPSISYAVDGDSVRKCAYVSNDCTGTTVQCSKFKDGKCYATNFGSIKYTSSASSIAFGVLGFVAAVALLL